MDYLWSLWRLAKPLFGRAANNVSQLPGLVATIYSRVTGTRQEVMYLPDPAMADLADCYAVVSGVRLPLHSQILSGQSGVLRGLFLTQREGGGVAAGERTLDISAAFHGGSLDDACILLELLYNPANIERRFLFKALSFQVLPGVARLAHKLDIAGVVDGIEAVLEALSDLPGPEVLPATLLTAIQTAQACQLDSLADSFLDMLGISLAAAGSRGPSLLPDRLLAGLDSTTLAQLVHASARAHGPWCDEGVRSSASAFVYDAIQYSGTSAGFTVCLDQLSQYDSQQYVAPDVPELCGYRWRLDVYPKGFSDAAGTHLSVFVCVDKRYPQGNVLVEFDVTICNQKVPTAAKHVRTPPWLCSRSDSRRAGWRKLLSLEELNMPAGGFTEDDRLMLRVEFTVLRTAPA